MKEILSEVNSIQKEKKKRIEDGVMEGRQKDQRKKVRNTENKQNPGGPSQVHVSHFLFLEKNKTKQNKTKASAS